MDIRLAIPPDEDAYSPKCGLISLADASVLRFTAKLMAH